MAEQLPELFIALYIDEDVTDALAPALRERGFESQSTIEAGRLAQPDDTQLEYAALHNMAILTANARDFLILARQWAATQREHAGIILTEQFRRDQFGELLRRVLKLLNTYTRDELRNQVLYLSQFRE